MNKRPQPVQMTKLRKPPGQRLINRMSTRTKWQLLTPVSVVVFVVGLCVFSEATARRIQGAPMTQWALWGAYGLILVVGGLLLFGQSQRFRSQLDYRRFVRRELKKRDRGRSRTQVVTGTKQKSSLGRSED